MYAFTWFADSTPFVPTPSPTIDPDSVTPGVAGFLAIAVIALAVVFLLVDMIRRIRRARYRAEIAEELDAEEAARADEATADPEAPDERDGTISPEDPAKD